MKFLSFLTYLFLIYETIIYLVKGQEYNFNLRNDCTKIYNYLNGDSNQYDTKSCCTEETLAVIKCDANGYIIEFEV